MCFSFAFFASLSFFGDCFSCFDGSCFSCFFATAFFDSDLLGGVADLALDVDFPSFASFFFFASASCAWERGSLPRIGSHALLSTTVLAPAWSHPSETTLCSATSDHISWHGRSAGGGPENAAGLAHSCGWGAAALLVRLSHGRWPRHEK